MILEAIPQHPELQQLRWLVLHTTPTRLYEKFGFRPLANPERHMEIVVRPAGRDLTSTA